MRGKKDRSDKEMETPKRQQYITDQHRRDSSLHFVPDLEIVVSYNEFTPGIE